MTGFGTTAIQRLAHVTIHLEPRMNTNRHGFKDQGRSRTRELSASGQNCAGDLGNDQV